MLVCKECGRLCLKGDLYCKYCGAEVKENVADYKAVESYIKSNIKPIAGHGAFANAGPKLKALQKFFLSSD